MTILRTLSLFHAILMVAAVLLIVVAVLRYLGYDPKEFKRLMAQEGVEKAVISVGSP